MTASARGAPAVGLAIENRFSRLNGEPEFSVEGSASTRLLRRQKAIRSAALEFLEFETRTQASSYSLRRNAS